MNSTKKLELYSFNASVQGASHIKTEKVCQDYSLSNYANKYAWGVVCDGHGSDKCFRSDIGSKFACEVYSESISEFMTYFLKPKAATKMRELLFAEPDKYIIQLEKSIISKWYRKIEEHYNSNPFTPDELQLMGNKHRSIYDANPESAFKKAYGTTLIGAVLFPGYFWFALQIGDGKCAVLDDSEAFSQPVPSNDKCFLNVTTSLCDDYPLSEFRHYFSNDFNIKAIFLGSDGIDDSFANDNDLHSFYKEVLDTFYNVKTGNMNKAKQEITDYLPFLSEKGSKDDVSVSGIINFSI